MLSSEKKDDGEVKGGGLQVRDRGEDNKFIPVNEQTIDEMFLDAPGKSVQMERFKEEDRKEISRRILAVVNNSNAVSPIQCRGEACVYLGICPFKGVQVFPLDQQCPIEQQLIGTKLNEYSLKFQVDRFNPVDREIIARLVEIDLLEHRLRSIVATRYPDVLLEEVVGVSPIDGHELKKLAVSPVMSVRKRLSEERVMLLKELVGTRKEQYKEKAALKKGNDADYSTYIAEMNRRLREITEKNGD